MARRSIRRVFLALAAWLGMGCVAGGPHLSLSQPPTATGIPAPLTNVLLDSGSTEMRSAHFRAFANTGTPSYGVLKGRTFDMAETSLAISSAVPDEEGE